MKPNMTSLGILLIVVGVLLLAYKGFTYTKHEKVAEIGDIAVIADTQKNVYIPPVIGAASLAAGIVMVALGRRRGE